MNDWLWAKAHDISHNKGVRKLKEMWDENPVAVLTIAFAGIAATAKLVDSVSSIRSKRAYANATRIRVTERRARHTW